MVTTTILDRFADYLRVELRLSPQTVETYVRECTSADSYARRNQCALEELNTANLIDYLVQRQSAHDPIDQRTVAKGLSALRSFFQFCILEQIRSDNPATTISSPRGEHRLPGVLSVDEVEQLLSEIDPDTPGGLRDRALFELIYSCGLRISEAVDLELHNLYLDEGLVLVRGKGDRERMVPLGDEAILWLKRYLGESRPKLVRTVAERAVFVNRLGRRLSRKGMWKRFHEISRSSGIEAKVHTLRHSFATHMLEGGADLRAVQELLGHADIGTTQIYTHIDTEDLREYHARFHPRSGVAPAEVPKQA